MVWSYIFRHTNLWNVKVNILSTVLNISWNRLQTHFWVIKISMIRRNVYYLVALKKFFSFCCIHLFEHGSFIGFECCFWLTINTSSSIGSVSFSNFTSHHKHRSQISNIVICDISPSNFKLKKQWTKKIKVIFNTRVRFVCGQFSIELCFCQREEKIG